MTRCNREYRSQPEVAKTSANNIGRNAQPVAANCPKCGKPTMGAKFCPECGTKVEASPAAGICSKCGAQTKGAKFCPECGTKAG